MDPDMALATIRALASTASSDAAGTSEDIEVIRAAYLTLAEHCLGLDEWLTSGGYLPRPWHQE